MDRKDLVNDAERRVWDAFGRGARVDLGPGDPAEDGFDPQTWGPDRTVRAQVIAKLLLGVRQEEPGSIGKLVLAGARISGELLLNGGTVQHELRLDRCWLDGEPDIGNAVTRGFTLADCRLPGLMAYGWQPSGTVRFAGSRFDGGISLYGARIGGVLSMPGVKLFNQGGTSLNAVNLTVEHDVFCRQGFTAIGTVSLYGAKIGGVLDLDGAALDGAGEKALMAASMTVGQGMTCADGFTAKGEVNIYGAKIGGGLVLTGATLANPGGDALCAVNVVVDGDMFCTKGFTVTGTVDLHGARINSTLELTSATLTSPQGRALHAPSLIVEQGMYCDFGFTAEGLITLKDARLSSISFERAELRLPAGADGTSHTTLNCESLTTGRMTLPAALPGVADLRQATVGTLAVPPEVLGATMRLTGLTYTDLDPDPDPPVKRRLAWLRRDPGGYHPQPYEQLAAYYRANGNDREARLVLLAKRRAQRAHASRRPDLIAPARRLVSVLRPIPGLIIDALAGYGYLPGRAFAWLLAAITAGAWALSAAKPGTPTADNGTNAVLLALDSIIPTSPFGLRDEAHLTGVLYVVAMALQGFGFALSIAVLPALTRALARTDK
ncbi:oxidoreductase [Catellatospora sp. TT07R-123]|uniref:hypothetical protein n=1 Tax=Catellatospora sp. TT07R-123 TaxID=2733863 RepID=UPI001B253338|nr:hypothetical protein [Catellatospora sp. TT07R-123]GHJ48326.1 oxidoreductase [Catellatospora sp. TT07R-123]